jgi:hemolysin D
MKFFKNKDEKDKHTFKPLLVEIEDRPLNPLGRGLLWIVVIFMVIASLWLYFAKVEVVVSARGKVIPDGEVKVIQPIETGVISSILVKEGEYVQKGQVLVEIDPTVTATNLTSKKEQELLLMSEIQRLQALIHKTDFVPDSALSKIQQDEQLQMYKTQKDSYESEIKSLKEQKNQINNDLKSITLEIKRLKTLYKNMFKKQQKLENVLDIIAMDDYEQVVNEVNDYKKQYEIKEVESQKLTSKLKELNHNIQSYEEKFKNELYEKAVQKEKELNDLSAQIETIEFQSAKQKLRSPVEGYITKKMIHTEGGVVTPAQELLRVVPKSSPLIMKVKVLNKDIGFIKKQMQSAVKIDTFNFQKYGLVEGEVMHISNDAIEDEQLGFVYEVFIKPKQKYMEVEGEKVTISSGMSVTAEVKVGKRRIIEFFIYPLIKYLDEGMSVR